MTEKEQKKAAKEFAERWKGRGYEKGESNLFWIDLLTHVYGVDNIAEFISFEDQVHLDHTSFIDGYIKSTHVMIEQKSIGKDLRKAIKQSDGSLLNPFQQAKRYVTELPVSQHPRWIVTCNFEEFLVYDMEKPNGEPEQIFLKDFAKDYYRLQFLVETGSEMLKKEMEISLKAGELVGKLYDAILKQYKEPDSPETLKSLNMLCVRLVFCLYAEDAGIFGKHEMFGRYLKQFQAKDIRKALIELFQVLDQKPEDRDPYMDDDLAAFPYVNGGLFADENIEIPRFTDEIVDLLVNNASAGFDWSEISPTIFGAVFESTLNPETRRSGGMHYTSIENIHKVIDPLFLDELKAEFNTICETKVDKTRKAKLEQFRDKLASLTFLDPACGSGNFLTETYISLRRLENEALKVIHGGQMLIGGEGDFNPIKVGIGQFYGIEINDFAVTVAKTALWIAEAQMMHETEEIIQYTLDFLPLKSYANITEGNSIHTDWESVVPKDKLSYIMGNPPFHGFTFMDKAQKEDMAALFKDVKNLDYVCAWYKKASDYIENTNIEVAFVSTNSITQGETVARFWDFMKGDIINFAHQTFIWDSEASLKAHVHCVIIGFSKISRQKKYIYNNGTVIIAQNINPYLYDGPNVIVSSRNKPLCDVPKMIYGNKPADGGFLIIEDEDYETFVKQSPQALPMIKPLIGAAEYIKGKKRWCLWLVDVSPKEIKSCPAVLDRVKKCKEAREASIAAGIRKFAETPTLFAQRTQPTDVDFIVVPRVSSQNRRYVPMGFIKAGTIVTDRVQIIPNANLYVFGVITSNVHMSWMRTTCMRLKSDYSYSKDIVYNNFPWCDPDEKQKALIEKTAQLILDARAKYPDCSLADLYDETTMPPELRKAHQLNDKAVMQAYGFDYKTMTESECVAELMKMYQKLTEK
ncbi:DNA methyltransferase [uncultured Ruminococcus sp.]|uniref:DNA methyltransferase n=1 Tax=uncultured Ruminococcus sp. TaxID=165186 RepID=UPI0025CF2CAC|nr:DNA methyltransferase [uncultured Ruminococcus sp.]